MNTQKTGTDCTQVTKQKTKIIRVQTGKKKKLEVSFSGGDITSDGGELLLRQGDRKLKLTNSLSQILPDPRNQSYIEHSWISMIKQRVFGIALGYEDLNDHEHLRKDPAMQAAVDREDVLASTPTLCRMEQSPSRENLVQLHKLLFEGFIAVTSGTQNFFDPRTHLIFQPQ